METAPAFVPANFQFRIDKLIQTNYIAMFLPINYLIIEHSEIACLDVDPGNRASKGNTQQNICHN